MIVHQLQVLVGIPLQKNALPPRMSHLPEADLAVVSARARR
jgi:hypothetical protein